MSVPVLSIEQHMRDATNQSSAVTPNPFTPPPEVDPGTTPVWTADGTLIVRSTQSAVRLPEICWLTGSTENLIARTIKLRRFTPLSLMCFFAAMFSLLAGNRLAKVATKLFSERLVTQPWIEFLFVLMSLAGFLGGLIQMRRIHVHLYEGRGIARKYMFSSERVLKTQPRSGDFAVTGFSVQFHAARKRLVPEEDRLMEANT